MASASTRNANVKDSKRDISLIENFIAEEEERALLSNVYGEEIASSSSSSSSWKVLSGRRVKQFGGTVNAQKTIGERLPEFLRELSARIENDERVKETYLLSSSASSPPSRSSSATSTQPLLKLNHVLVNEYELNKGIASHQDGPLYTNFVCVVSLMRDEVVSFTPHADFAETMTPFDVFVPRRSLLVFYGKSYDCYLHGIRGKGSACAEHNDDEKKRVSLTFRNVKNLSIPGKALSRLLFGKRF
jgi:hypothetical protein